MEAAASTLRGTGSWFFPATKRSLSLSRKQHLYAYECGLGRHSYKLQHHLQSQAGILCPDDHLGRSSVRQLRTERGSVRSIRAGPDRADGVATEEIVQHPPDRTPVYNHHGVESDKPAYSEAVATADTLSLRSESNATGSGASLIDGRADLGAGNALGSRFHADGSVELVHCEDTDESSSSEAQDSSWDGMPGGASLGLDYVEEATSSDGSYGVDSAEQGDREAESAPGVSGRKPRRKQYVWPELRNSETEEPDYEFLAVDPSKFPERVKSSKNASSSGRADKYMAPKPKDTHRAKAPSVKREPSAAAQRCLTLLREYKDPANLPYEEFKETLRTWVAENAPCRADGMDILRKLLEFREIQVFVRVNEHFLREPWFKAQLRDINKLLDVLVTNRMFLKAESRWGKMLRKGIAPDRTTYNLMIHHYGLWRKPDKAEEMFLEMRTQGIRPNEDTFVALMGALTRAGRLVEAERLLRTMRKSRCPRGPAAYVTLMEAYGHEEEPEEAERIFLMIQADGIPLTLPAFLGLMHVYAELRKPHQVERVFREMLSRRILPNEIAYLVLIDSYRKAGLGKNCERLVEEMQLLGLSPYKAAALIMEAYGAEQLFSEAERILIDLEAKTGLKPGIMHYNALLAAYGRHGLHKDAMKVFDWMTEAGVALNQRSHVLIMDLFDRNGRKANLRTAFRVMQSDGFGLEYEAAEEAVMDYRATLNEYQPEMEEVREERLRKRAERAAQFMQKWDTWSRELDELDREIAEVEMAAERKLDKWESRMRV